MNHAQAESEREFAGLYLHVPFCSAICPYCDFAVTTGRQADLDRFVASLIEEIQREEHGQWSFDTIYFGGGTPSALNAEALARVLSAVRDRFDCRPGTRVFFEANPEDVTEESLEAWRALGVETLSLGVQSFEDDELRFLARRHDGNEARRSVELALQAGFQTVSVDLIFGMPCQTLASLERNLAQVSKLGSQHVSCYQLTIHEGTPFYRLRESGKLVELVGSAQADLFESLHDGLATRGFAAYEVSNFASKPEHRSKHNRKYWQHVDYLGLGPSAHSFRDSRRWWNVRDIVSWTARLAAGDSPVEGGESLSSVELATEKILLGLRTIEGIDLRAYERDFGTCLELEQRSAIEGFRSKGWIAESSDRLALTTAGMAVADAIALELAPSCS